MDVTRALDEQGFVVFREVVDRAWLAELRAAFEEAAAAKPRSDSGTRHVEPLQGAVFERVVAHPEIASAVAHILQRPYGVFGFHGRDPRPGFGQQGLHADWTARVGNAYAIVTTLWMLDDFTRDNGATRIVPATHRRGAVPKNFADPNARHPDETIVVAPAGSVLLFNGHLWHSGTRNRSTSSRRALQLSFAASEFLRHG
ncbi:MAG: phytanoyl-CoA dioxygenase family protein [Acidobacteria bacterium]|nr:phytanoyl-CoA dioxygenase family protein [Acidobacteriota bacterium]MBV9475509.1 phytanoyl-CoA dioxygenase family protein [Acidobacteriota bacterium]